MTQRPPDGSQDPATLADELQACQVTITRLALLEQEQQGLLAALPDIVYVVDTEGRLRHWNRKLEEVTGYRPDELAGKPAMDFFPEDERELHLASLKKKLSEGYDEVESHLLTKDGRRLLHHWIGVALRDDEGRVMGVIGTARDVTERHAMEMALREQNDRLQELDRLKSQFVNAVSHELRTPLTTIAGYLEFLEDGIGGPLTEAQQEYTHQIKEGTRRLKRLVDDLLDFARLEAGTFKLQAHEFALGPLVADVVESLRPQAMAKHLRLTTAVPRAGVEACGDATRIEQVILNLVHNAVKFTPEGGSVSVSLEAEPGTAVVRVRDTGPGIAPEEQQKLFQRFSQLSSGGGMSHAGVGLGLFIAKAIVTAHGGEIGVESEPGRGACFWFRVPAGSCPADASG